MIKSLGSFFTKGHQRTVLAKKNILFSFFIKVVGMFVVFAMVSVSIKYLGKENYGIWIVLSGLISWSNVFDLGFSHGLRNRLAEAQAKNNIDIGKYYVSTTYAFLLLVALTLSVVFLPLFSFLDWQNILNTTAVDNETIKYTAFIIYSFFILQFMLKPIGSILESFQLPALSQFISLIGSVLALLGALYLLFTDRSPILSRYAYLVSGTPIIALLLASIYFYSKKFKNLIPSIKYVQRKYFKNIASLGISFFIIQLSVLIIFQSDTMIISYLFGPKEVTEYNIVYRYFSIIITAFSVIVAPFWTAFTDAYQKGDFEWIRKTMKTLFFFVGGSILVSFLFFLVSNNIYRAWIDNDIVIPALLSGLMGIYVIILNILNILAFFFNGIGKIKIQLIASIFSATINIPLSYFFAKVLNYGTSGVVLATIISISVLVIILLIQYKMIINRKAVGIWNL